MEDSNVESSPQKPRKLDDAVETGVADTEAVLFPMENFTAVEATKTTPTKGYVLRKWRRMRRDLNKDGSVSADSAHILKRRFSGTKFPKTLEENKMKSKAEAEDEDSAASFQSRNAEINPELERLASSDLSIGMVSENSKNYNCKQIFQQWRAGRIDSNKKSRGDQAKFVEEISHSSVESDLRSSAAKGRTLNSDEFQTKGEIHLDYSTEKGREEKPFREDLDAGLLYKNASENHLMILFLKLWFFCRRRKKHLKEKSKILWQMERIQKTMTASLKEWMMPICQRW